MASVEVPLLVNRADDDVSSDDGTRQPSNATASSIEEETAAPVRYQSKGKRFLNYLKNADWDRYLAYHANKIVKIKDWRLAVLDYSLVGVVLFIVFYVFLYTKEAYKATDSGQGALKISIVDPGNIPATAPYCSSNCHTFSGTEPGCECIFLDENDVVYPESEEYSTFITTKFSRHIQQTKKDFCNDSVCTSPWTEGAQDSYYVLNPDEFIIQTFHVSLAPKFLSEDVLDHNGQLPSAHTYNSKYMSSSFQLWGHVLDSTGEPILLLPPRKSDQIPLKVYLQECSFVLFHS
ncbi:hypothetical protein Pelo_17440 [Pelomyxa schiedti]|nr:hypothetical protein Pelo_17440 [Pelomyxa schiedti]